MGEWGKKKPQTIYSSLIRLEDPQLTNQPLAVAHSDLLTAKMKKSKASVYGQLHNTHLYVEKVSLEAQPVAIPELAHRGLLLMEAFVEVPGCSVDQRNTRLDS